jgi:hypothetical protein
MDKYILDTNVYDYLFDNTIDIEKLKIFADFYSVIVQLSEINNIKDEAKKAALLNFYSKLSLKKLFLKSGIWINELLWDNNKSWINDIQHDVYQLLGDSKQLKA